MNKTAYIERLRKCLKHLPKEDIEDAISYYTEYFEEMDADEEQDVTISLGQPEDIAKDIIANCTRKHIDTQKENGGFKNSVTVIWMILLAILAAPLAIPLALAAVMVLLALILVLLSLVFSVACAGTALIASALMSFAAAIFAAGIAQKLVCLGVAFFLLGLGILLLIATTRLGAACTRLIAALFQKIWFRKKVER